MDTILHFSTRAEWRNWLSAHSQDRIEAWLVYPKALTGKPGILYNDAVEEALCFGWIDSNVKSLDEGHTMQRFTPRKPASSFSQANIERLKWLNAHDLVHPEVRLSVESALRQVFVFPRRIRIAYIDAARNRPEEFSKRLAHFIRRTHLHKLIRGYGGIEKYY